jgi:hypothetical protein
MPTEQPDIFAILEGAVKGAWPLMRSRMSVYGILAAITAVAGLAVPLASMAGSENETALRIQLAVQPVSICGGIAVFFALAAAARTVRPEFRMTFINVLAVIGIGILVGVVTELGIFLLIVPGVWIAVKWSQAIWSYLLSEGKSPFEESWQITTGHFWETFGFNILLSLVITVVSLALFAAPLIVAVFMPVLAVVMSPIALLGYVFAYNIAALGQMRWLLELRRLPAPAPPIPVAPA